MDPIWGIYVYIYIYITPRVCLIRPKNITEKLSPSRGGLVTWRFLLGDVPPRLRAKAVAEAVRRFRFSAGVGWGVGWVVLVELDGFLQNSPQIFVGQIFKGHQIFDDEDLSFPPTKIRRVGYIIFLGGGWLVGVASRGSKMGEIVHKVGPLAVGKMEL